MKISRTLAIAMENYDYSGLDPKDITDINYFWEQGSGHGFNDFTVIEWNEDSNDINGKCRITGLYDHCVEIELTKRGGVK